MPQRLGALAQDGLVAAWVKRYSRPPECLLSSSSQGMPYAQQMSAHRPIQYKALFQRMHQWSAEPTLRLQYLNCLEVAVVSTGGRNTLVFEQRWSVGHEVSSPYLLFSRSAVQRVEIWDRWQRGESMSSIGRAFDRQSSSVFSVISPTGGIRPPLSVIRTFGTDCCVKYRLCVVSFFYTIRSRPAVSLRQSRWTACPSRDH